MARTVEVVSVGTELLLGQITNTNAPLLAKVLAAHGAQHYFQVVVGDNRGRLVTTLRQALGRADMVVTIGGLGPTDDDLTKEAVAEVFGLPMALHQPSWEAILARFSDRGQPTPNNRRQAEMPAGATAIPNAHGTAPGVLLEAGFTGPGATPGPRVVVCLPGPPTEFGPMVEGYLADYLERWCAAAGERLTFTSRSLRVAGPGESQVAHDLQDLIRSGDNPTIATYAKPGDVEVRITARAGSPDAAWAMIAPVEAEVRRRLAPWVYGADDDSLGSAVIKELTARHQTVAVAESCTGGTLADRLTSSPGASRAFVLGVVAYAPEAKVRLVDVAPGVIAEHGVVSEAVAGALAQGVRARAQADFGVGVTGVAGPDGGTAENPVGTVWIAVASPGSVVCRRLQLRGDRAQVRSRATQHALVLLRQQVLDPGGTGSA